MTVHRYLSYSLLAAGTVAVVVTLRLSGEWPYSSLLNTIGAIIGTSIVLLLALAVIADGPAPLRSRPTALFTVQLLLAAAVLPLYQKVYNFAVGVAAIIAAGFIICVSYIALCGLSQARSILQVISVVSLVLMGADAAFWFEASHRSVSLTNGLALLVSGPVLVGFLLPYLKKVFEGLVAIEERRVRPGPLPPDLQVQADDTSLRTLGLSLAGLITILWLTVAVAPSVGFTAGQVSGGDISPILGSAASVIGIAYLSWRLPYRKHSYRVCTLANLIWLFGSMYSIIRDPYFHPLLLAPLLLCGLWTWLTLTFTPVVIRNQSMPRRHLVVPLLCVLSILTGFYWAMTDGIYKDSRVILFGWSLLPIFLSCLVSLALVVVTGMSLASRSAASSYGIVGPLYGAIRGLLQDHLLLIAQVVLLVWFPAYVIAHVPPAMRERLVAVSSIVGGLILFASPVLFWMLRLHVRHTAFERHLRLRTPRLVSPYPILMQPVLPTLISVLRKCGPGINRPISSDVEWCDVNAGNVNARNLIAVVMTSFSALGILGILNNYRD